MDVSNPWDDCAEQNRGYAEVPHSTVIPRVVNAHLQQNPISDSYTLHKFRKWSRNYSCYSAVSEDTSHRGLNLFKGYIKTSDWLLLIPSLQTCLNKSAFLQTQMPLPHTVTDFWRLVYDQHVSTIVMMNNINDDDEVGFHWKTCFVNRKIIINSCRGLKWGLVNIHNIM